MARIIKFPGQPPLHSSEHEHIENLERGTAQAVRAIESVIALLDQLQKTAGIVRAFRADQVAKSARNTESLGKYAQAAGTSYEGRNP